ncbi:MAG: glycosyltransferase family 4 protein [Chloroflexota bacterium]|nr:glycosyltransferase family 4 protein [Chloroflexota bacterium]
MRICMIMSTPLPPREGIGFYVWNLSRYLVDLGHQVQIITRGRAGTLDREVVDGIPIWRPPFLPLYPFHVHFHSIFVNKLVKRLAPTADLLHLHTPLVKCPRTENPVIVTVHSPMKADTRTTPIGNLMGLLIHLQGPVSYRLEQELFTRANKLATVARQVAEDLRLYRIDRRQVHVLGNGVDTRLFSPSSCDPNKDTPYFLTVARLAPGKGLEDLIRCAAHVVRHHPSYRFLIAGAGPLEGELREAIARGGLQDAVVLLGHIGDRDRLVNLYRGATAYVHPSHHEGLPTVLLEAMACGRPVVTTAVGGALDIVQHERNGLLVPPKRPRHMAGAIMRLLQTPDFAKELGAAAVQTIESRYSWEIVSRNYLAQYESLVEGAQS